MRKRQHKKNLKAGVSVRCNYVQEYLSTMEQDAKKQSKEICDSHVTKMIRDGVGVGSVYKPRNLGSRWHPLGKQEAENAYAVNAPQQIKGASFWGLVILDEMPPS